MVWMDQKDMQGQIRQIYQDGMESLMGGRIRKIHGWTDQKGWWQEGCKWDN